MTSEELAHKGIELCRKRGAEHAEAMVNHRLEKAVSVFRGEVTTSGSSETIGITLRVFRKLQGAVVLGAGTSDEMLKATVDHLFKVMERTAPDKLLGPAEPDQMGKSGMDLGLYDQRLSDVSIAQMSEIALAGEASAVARDSRVQEFVTSTLQVQTNENLFCDSRGFRESYRGTVASLSLNAVMESGSGQPGTATSDGDPAKVNALAFAAARNLEKLDTDKVAGRMVRQLESRVGAKSCLSGSFPVLLSPGVSRILAAVLVQQASGGMAATEDGSPGVKIGDRVCSDLITLVDDPTREGALGAIPFDHEGVIPRRKVVIERGLLKEHLLNSYFGRMLELPSTGNGLSSGNARYTVRPLNAFVEPGATSADDIIADIKQGLYVTRFISQSVSLGPNFVQAATGFWIEDGKIAHPVRATAIAAASKAVNQNIVAVGNDLESEGGGAVAPTLLISKMHLSPLA